MNVINYIIYILIFFNKITLLYALLFLLSDFNWENCVLHPIGLENWPKILI